MLHRLRAGQRGYLCRAPTIGRLGPWSGSFLIRSEVALASDPATSHLTPRQKAMIAAKALPIFEAEAKTRQREHGRTAPGREKSLPAVAPEVFAPGTRRGRHHAAALIGASSRRISDAKRQRSERPI
jgi:hypothetical protein